jgi:hypothetical protein
LHEHVGTDAAEELCPPYTEDAAVDQVLEEKFGPNGVMSTPTCSRLPRTGHRRTYMRNAGTPGKVAIGDKRDPPGGRDRMGGPRALGRVSPVGFGRSSRTWRSRHRRVWEAVDTRRQAEGKEIWLLMATTS